MITELDVVRELTGAIATVVMATEMNSEAIEKIARKLVEIEERLQSLEYSATAKRENAWNSN